MYQIYPKSLLRTKLKPKPSQCFVLMPFQRSFDEVYSEIKSSLGAIGFGCTRADDIYANRPIMNIIISEIMSSHFVIADLTDRNPNVFYEVGIAHSFRDMANVILLSQSIDHVPFDLRHLPVIIYDPENMRSLTSRLTKRIHENKGFFEGQIHIRELYQQQIRSEGDFEEIFSFLEDRDRALWRLIIFALDLTGDDLSEGDVVYGVFQMRAELSGLIAAGRLKLFRNLFKLYKDILFRFVEMRQVDEYVSETLQHQRFSDFPVDDAETSGMLIELAITLFRHPRFKRRALEWLFGYLARPKVAGIDLNRSRVEHFVLYTDDVDVRDALIYTLEHPNPYMRETVADFIGEMRLQGGVRNLVLALAKEISPFAARSMFSALGKLESTEGAQAIIGWIKSHKVMIEQQKWDFVIDHARNATSAIDSRHGTQFYNNLTILLVD
jgi:hypothetical protein